MEFQLDGGGIDGPMIGLRCAAQQQPCDLPSDQPCRTHFRGVASLGWR